MKHHPVSHIVRDLIDRVLLAEPSAKAMNCWRTPQGTTPVELGVVVRLPPCERRFQVEVRCDDETHAAGPVLALVVVAKDQLFVVRNLLCEKLSEEFASVRTVTYAH